MNEKFEERVRAIAISMQYPPTPDVRRAVMMHVRSAPPVRFLRPRLAWALALIVVLFSGLMLVPPARAAILEFIQIGIVRIFAPQPTTPPPNVEIPRTALPGPFAPLTATPAPPLESTLTFFERLAGATTLDEAREAVEFPILLPDYPADLGQPNRVFLQDANGAIVILVWLEPADPERVRMSLHLIEAGSWAIEKMRPAIIEETTVDGTRAVWTIGPYPLLLKNREAEFTRLIDGHVLIWSVGDITYRLETDLSLEEAVRVAESLR